MQIIAPLSILSSLIQLWCVSKRWELRTQIFSSQLANRCSMALPFAFFRLLCSSCLRRENVTAKKRDIEMVKCLIKIENSNSFKFNGWLVIAIIVTQFRGFSLHIRKQFIQVNIIKIWEKKCRKRFLVLNQFHFRLYIEFVVYNFLRTEEAIIFPPVDDLWIWLGPRI